MRSAILLFLLCAAGAAQTPPARQFLLRLEPVRKDFTLQTMTEAERPVVGEHVAYLTGLLAKGTLTFAGQAFDPKGFWGIVVVNAPDLEAAKAILNGDPVIKSKLFAGEAIPFRTVFERGSPPPAAAGSPN